MTDIKEGLTREQVFMRQLRSATGPMHEKLEATTLSKSLMSPGLSLSAYATYLAHMRNVVGWSEANIFPMLAQVVPDLHEREKLSALDADLELLRGKAAWAHIPLYTGDAGAMKSMAAALGHMYVMEGATLGGRVILDHIQDTLGLDPQNGAAFFNGYGSMTGMRWKTFLSIFTAYTIANSAGDEVIEGAISTFASIEHYFAGN